MAKSIFMAYSDSEDDLKIYEELERHFIVMSRSKLIQIVDKDELLKLARENKEVSSIAMTCDYIIPILSVDLLNDDKCLQIIKTVGRDTNKIIIPILARSCLYDDVEELKPFLNHVIPQNKKSIMAISEEDGGTDEIFTEITLKIKNIIFGKIENYDLGSNIRFLYLSIFCFVIGLSLSVFAFRQTSSVILLLTTLLLFMTLTVISVSKYLVNREQKNIV